MTLPDQTIGRWQRFEIAIENPAGYSDPYMDVTLTVTYTRPDGSTVDFWGFYDGGTTWRLRFMPDQFGVWRYTARFSDGMSGIFGARGGGRSQAPNAFSG